MFNGSDEIIVLEFPGVESLRWKMIDGLIAALGHAGIAAGLDDYTLRLVIDEALTNAMEHGNKWDPDKRICIRAYRSQKGLAVVIQDEGDGFDADAYREYVPSLRMRGRGIHIIRHFCIPEWNEKGNIITLNIAFRFGG